ncbi:hypothetical protein DIX60_01905 [Streptococcus iniae]|uniref:hypothetical protein n=1 Tax=Streptococcus iniae TaxID=1346 RepID=UPI0008D9F2F3|nr:hypothetical protein [Streptococcus iniae]OHX26243.1 hypothetical protein BKX95_11455 [Streptococcus iniae]RLV28425.1 hypothetical protein DIX60_01905 [Streptococcus iniae]
MNKRLLGIVAILVILIGGGVAMKSIFTGEIKTSKPQHINAKKLLKEQEDISLYLTNTYEGVQLIEFKEIKADKLTGSHELEVVINRTETIFVTFGEYGQKDYTERYNPKNFHLKERRESNTSTDPIKSVKVKYIGE